MTARARPLLAKALRAGLSAEALEDRCCGEILDAAYCVHGALGGVHETLTYRNALALELGARGLRVHREATFSVLYRERVVGTYQADLLVEERVLVQIASADSLGALEKAEMLRGLHSGGVQLGLLFHFRAPELSFARIL